MTQIRRRLDKDFPVIRPQNSAWEILDILDGCSAIDNRLVARSAGFKGDIDILLAAPLPSPASPQKNEALGLFYVGESARRYGFSVEYWDARHDDEKEFWDKLSRSNTVGFTAITGYQLLRFIDLAEKIKKLAPKLPIILGGAHATLTRAEVNLKDPLVDFVVMGEGELRLPALLRALYLKEGMELVDGIGYKTQDGEIIYQQSRHVPDPKQGHLVRAVSRWTLPYFIEAASRNEMILPTSRGCPWSVTSCDFCSVGKQYMDSYRSVPFELWQADIMEVHNLMPIRHIELEDENSAVAIRKHEPYLPLLKSIGATCHLHLRSDQLLDSERVKWMAEMGVSRVHIGVESGNERVLNEVMHKNENVGDHFIAARNLAKADIEMVGTYIVANPTETWEEIKDTLQLADDLSKVFPKTKYRATIYVLAALPGTPIFNTIEIMHQFNKLLLKIEKEISIDGVINEESRAELIKWYRSDIRPVPSDHNSAHPKAADTVQKLLGEFIINQSNFSKMKEESQKWLWPTPDSLRGWTKASAAYNPFLPSEYNAIYPIAGIHHNKHHKTKQNFPGWKRILIKPFEIIFDLRYHFRFFKYAGGELWAVSKLINWASKRSVGSDLDIAHRSKVIESYSETLAGH